MTHHVLKTPDEQYVGVGTNNSIVDTLEEARVYPSKRAASASRTRMRKLYRYRTSGFSAEAVAVRITERLEAVLFADMVENEPYFWVRTNTEEPDRTKFYFREGSSLFNQDRQMTPVSPTDRFIS